MDPIRCPTAPLTPGGEPHTIIGCGSTNVSQCDLEPHIWDCGDCGIWFEPTQEGVNE